MSKRLVFDCALSIGPACRPAFYLKRFFLRRSAAPLDWQMDYSLDTVIHLFKSGFDDFFEEIEDIPEKAGKKTRCVKDTQNNIVSLHHFPIDETLPQTQKKLRETMLKRFERIDKMLKSASDAVLVCNRDASLQELTQFGKKFQELYSPLKLTVINIKNTPGKGMKSAVVQATPSLVIMEYFFEDEHPQGSDISKNFEAWKGNIRRWDSIIGKIRLSDSCGIATDIKIQKMLLTDRLKTGTRRALCLLRRS